MALKSLRQSEKGVTSAEFALVLPTFLLAVMVLFAVALWLFSLLLAGTGVPTGARAAGTEAGLGGGYARLQTIMGIVQPAAGAAGAAPPTQSPAWGSTPRARCCWWVSLAAIGRLVSSFAGGCARPRLALLGWQAKRWL